MEGDLESRQLRLASGPADWRRSLVKAARPNGAQESEASPQPAGKVLPYDRFETDKWQVMDADVRFKGRRIEHGGTLPISDLSTHVILEQGDLRLQRLRLWGWPTARLPAAFILKGIKNRCRGRRVPAGAPPEAESADAKRGSDAEPSAK
ncbi:AsmA family protein [Escherichia coli]